jgi:hypothetical protein
MVALSASKLAWLAIALIMSVTAPILAAASARLLTRSLVRADAWTASPAIAEDVETRRHRWSGDRPAVAPAQCRPASAIAAETDGGLVAGNDLCARQHQNGVATAFEGSLPHHVVAMVLRRTGEEFHGQSALKGMFTIQGNLNQTLTDGYSQCDLTPLQSSIAQKPGSFRQARP